jgi:ubiquinone/menaquinone biosynthesis C-methylase UbiE
MTYHPDPYWSQVAREIGQRGKKNFLAGDDSPFFRYKREKFLSLFHHINFTNKKVMEVGSGPGGNLNELVNPAIEKIFGVDISSEMIALAKNNLADHPNFQKMEFIHINGQQIPLVDKSIDVAYTVTVLQHNTDEAMLFNLIAEICRVTKDEICIFERIDSKIRGSELCYGRPVNYYQSIFEKNGFKLQKHAFLNTRVSHFVCTAISKLFNKPSRKEGEPLSGLSVFLQNISLPITKQLDKLFEDKREVAFLHFKRVS